MKTVILCFNFISCLLMNTIIKPSNNMHELFDTAVLKNSAAVQKILFSHGFTKICFTTQDNFKICGLFLDQSQKHNIKGTIIYCAGFYPGTKEGMTSFYALLSDQPYNFLFFDARGHQESDGTLFSYNNLKQYGSSEYQDIIAALDFLQKYNTEHHIAPDIIIHGICSGAFHSIKALEYLQKTDCPLRATVKGVIFDSGWLQLVDIVEPTVYAEARNYFKNSYLAWLATPISFLITQFYRCFLKQHHLKINDIQQSFATATCPIFFIHCTDDPYVPIAPIKTLANNLRHPYSWWITHDSHATYHLKEQELYAQKIKDFLNCIL